MATWGSLSLWVYSTCGDRIGGRRGRIGRSVVVALCRSLLPGPFPSVAAAGRPMEGLSAGAERRHCGGRTANVITNG